MAKFFYCKYCGAKSATISSLTSGSCRNNSEGKRKHVVYEGEEKRFYFCKYCGAKSATISSLTCGSCRNHPKGNGGKHEPAL